MANERTMRDFHFLNTKNVSIKKYDNVLDLNNLAGYLLLTLQLLLIIWM